MRGATGLAGSSIPGNRLALGDWATGRTVAACQRNRDPKSKDSGHPAVNYMKYVYLDQMHWIALARAAKGRSDGSVFVEVLDAAQGAVTNGRAVFPVSFAHLLETARAPRPEQRADLAALMTSLSMGVVLRWSRPVVEFQLRNAVRRLFGDPLLQDAPSPFGRGVEDVFCVDLSALLNLPPDRAARLRKSLDTPDAWISLLSYEDEASRRAGINSTDRIAKEAVDEHERRRATWAGENGDFTRRAYAVLLTRMFWLELQRYLNEIGRTVDEWGNSGPESLMGFWESIPSLHVEMELSTQMHRQTSKAWTTRDDRDIGFLSLAIPTCSVVVTEKFWVELSHRRKLHDRYGTVLLSDLRDLRRHIQAM